MRRTILTIMSAVDGAASRSTGRAAAAAATNACTWAERDGAHSAKRASCVCLCVCVVRHIARRKVRHTHIPAALSAAAVIAVAATAAVRHLGAMAAARHLAFGCDGHVASAVAYATSSGAYNLLGLNNLGRYSTPAAPACVARTYPPRTCATIVASDYETACHVTLTHKSS